MTTSPPPPGSSSTQPFSGVFSGKTVWMSGHTGFKGSWLTLWLLRLGARVHGFSLPPPTSPSLFEQLSLRKKVHHEPGDIRDPAAVLASIQKTDPDFVFHLAAQPLVRRSYDDPVETFSTNIMGTVHVLEALRHLKKKCAAVIVTSDKCYRNDEAGDPFSEGDPLGGRDPYSASKAACEMVAEAYRHSFLQTSRVVLASARAGNVIGGGDWAADRLIPDCVRALVGERSIRVRNPHAVRPWQHVLEPLCGYLSLARMLHCSEEGTPFAGAFNFGPSWNASQSVLEVVHRVLEFWPGKYEIHLEKDAPAEAHLLRLSIDKAEKHLGWRPVWDCEVSIRKTLEWYRANQEEPGLMREFSEGQIQAYEKSAAREEGPCEHDL